MIEFRCSQCGKDLAAEDPAAGTSFSCPQCGQWVHVPTLDSPTPDRSQAALDAAPTPPKVRKWYYIQGGHQRGPIWEYELAWLLQTEELGPDTYVWTGGLSDWIRAGEAAQSFPGAFFAGPPPIPLRELLGPIPSLRPKQVRPWVRYCARTIDLFLFASLIGFCWGIAGAFMKRATGLHLKDVPGWILGPIICLCYACVEPILLAVWGTTLGKALLKVRLRRADGSWLSFEEALWRSFKVWFRGCAMGIPILTLITYFIAYFRLKNRGVTSWDQEGGFVVTYQKIGAGRVIVALLILIGLTVLSVLAQMPSK